MLGEQKKEQLFFDMGGLHPYDCAPMQKQPLPRQVDVRKMANQKAEISAIEPVSSFTRFAEILASDAGEVALELQFGRDEFHQFRLQGSVSTEVHVSCNRCLQPMAISVSSSLEIGLVWSEDQAKALPKRVDPVLLEEDVIDLLPLVEDELIVSTPYVNYHPESECSEQANASFAPEAEELEEVVEEESPPNPFAVLKDLKTDR